MIEEKMMTEEEKQSVIEEIFPWIKDCYRSEMTTWRNYAVGYCALCETLYVSCPHCGNSSCNGGGCEKCLVDFTDFYTSLNRELRKVGIKRSDCFSQEGIESHAKKSNV